MTVTPTPRLVGKPLEFRRSHQLVAFGARDQLEDCHSVGFYWPEPYSAEWAYKSIYQAIALRTGFTAFTTLIAVGVSLLYLRIITQHIFTHHHSSSSLSLRGLWWFSCAVWP
jgi:hypothetical protein